MDDTNMRYIPVVFVFDVNYAKYASVAIYSLVSNSKCRIKIYCIAVDGAEKEAVAIQTKVREFNADMVVIPLQDAVFMSWSGRGHISAAAYGKIFIPDLIEEDKVIYLDCDLIVTCDLVALFEHDCCGFPLAGCRDTGRTAMPRHQEDIYVNTGVMLMDLAMLRREGFSATAQQVYATHGALATFADQCIINKVLEGRKSVLPPHWNMMVHEAQLGRVRERLERFIGHGIVHFTTGRKAWMRWSDQWVSALWLAYAAPVWPADEPLMIEPSKVEHLQLWVQVLEAEGRLPEAYAVRGQVIEALSGYIDQAVGPALDYAAVSRTHRAKLTDHLAALVGQQVQAGPFRGMKLPATAVWGDGGRAPKILGTYEEEILPALMDFVARRPGLVINVGCSEGYYAVGLARLLSQSRVVAFDVEESAQQVCAEAAELNGVSVDVVGRCTLEGLAAFLMEDPAPLVVMDCDGDELALLDPVAVPQLARADILVECHDLKLRGLQEALLERLAVTHDVEVVRQGARNPHALAVLQGFAEQDRWLLMSESRLEPGCWLVCRARWK